MTIVLKLRAKGFKSFANQTDLVFGNDFNCILGPNGSGKSNVMDALCFVLGKSSAKGLRAEKSANLIFNGGKKGRPAKEAEVSIWFSNDEHEFPVDTKEVKISRILRKTGNSIYKINDKTHTRQQVVDLLAKANIDPDGHSIVLQGDIVKFMGMRPVDRRVLLEEVAGISVFDDKKNKALNELDHVQDKLNQINIILTERETHLRELRKDRDQAKRFLEVKKRFVDNKATQLHMKLKQRERRKEDFDKFLSNFDSKLNQIKSKVDEYKNKINEKNTGIREINDILDQRGEQEHKVLRIEIAKLNSDVIKHNARIDNIKSELIKIDTRVRQIKSEGSDSDVQIKSLENEKKRFVREVSEVEGKEKKINEKIEEFKKKYGIEDLGSFSTKIGDIDSEIEKKRALIKSATEAKQDIIRELDITKYELEKVNATIEKLSGNKEGAELKRLKTEVSKFISSLNKLRAERDTLETQLEKNSDNLIAANNNLAKVKAKSDGTKERILGNLAIKKVLESKGNGVYGTVSELGDVEQKFSTALEVAAGGRTKSVVVDSDSTAATHIRSLKQNKLGVVTFLPLNKIKIRKKNPADINILKQNGVYEYAVKLINFNPQFKNIFEYVFSNTIVVENLNIAREIGVGRARMVTLEGDLVEPSGAMVGGHRKKTSMGFSQKKMDEELEKAENNRNRLDKLISEIYTQKASTDDKIYSIQKEKANVEGEVIKIEKSMGIDSTSTNIIDQVNSLKTKRSELESELSGIDTDVNKFETELSGLQKRNRTIKDGLSKIEESGIDKLELEQTELFKQKIKIQSDIKTIDNKIQMISDERGKFGKVINQALTDKEDFKKESVDLLVVIKNNKSTLREKEKEEQSFYGKFKSLTVKRNKLTEDVQSIQKFIEKEEENIAAVQARKNKVSVNVAQVIAEISGIKEESEEFKDGIIRRNVDLPTLQEEIKKDDRIIKNIGNVNMKALEIFDKIKEEYDKLLEKVSILKSEREDVLSMIDEVEQSKKGVFMETYNELNSKFRETFSYLYSKGEASLVLEDPEDPLSAGVDIKVKTAKNKYLDIRSLSGGEKTLAALSFIFAIQEHNPASFYLMDEVDAALDKHNSEKLSKLFNKYAHHAQYIVISHNDSVIGEANQIYGVSMQDEISKVTSLKI
jgi:chromosome segregation protein